MQTSMRQGHIQKTENPKKHWGPWTGGNPPPAQRKTAEIPITPAQKEQMDATQHEAGSEKPARCETRKPVIPASGAIGRKRSSQEPGMTQKHFFSNCVSLWNVSNAWAVVFLQ